MVQHNQTLPFLKIGALEEIEPYLQERDRKTTKLILSYIQSRDITTYLHGQALKGMFYRYIDLLAVADAQKINDFTRNLREYIGGSSSPFDEDNLPFIVYNSLPESMTIGEKFIIEPTNGPKSSALGKERKPFTLLCLIDEIFNDISRKLESHK